MLKIYLENLFEIKITLRRSFFILELLGIMIAPQVENSLSALLDVGLIPNLDYFSQFEKHY